MKSLYNIVEFDIAKSRDLLPLECEICHNTFYKTKHDIQWASKCSYKNCLRVCGKQCRTISRDKRVNTPCHYCGKITQHTQRQIKINKFSFCSNSCGTKYWNVHKTWGSPRSKLELWLEKELTKKYSNLEIKYNDRKNINAELDIYIPSLKLAFELNGIFHYEPIYGEEQLDKVQNNDKRKFQACLENNIELCIIDTHNAKYFKQERDQKFLDIIINIINNKLAEDKGIAPLLVLPRL